MQWQRQASALAAAEAYDIGHRKVEGGSGAGWPGGEAVSGLRGGHGKIARFSSGLRRVRANRIEQKLRLERVLRALQRNCSRNETGAFCRARLGAWATVASKTWLVHDGDGTFPADPKQARRWRASQVSVRMQEVDPARGGTGGGDRGAHGAGLGLLEDEGDDKRSG